MKLFAPLLRGLHGQRPALRALRAQGLLLLGLLCTACGPQPALQLHHSFAQGQWLRSDTLLGRSDTLRLPQHLSPQLTLRLQNRTRPELRTVFVELRQLWYLPAAPSMQPERSAEAERHDSLRRAQLVRELSAPLSPAGTTDTLPRALMNAAERAHYNAQRAHTQRAQWIKEGSLSAHEDSLLRRHAPRQPYASALAAREAARLFALDEARAAHRRDAHSAPARHKPHRAARASLATQQPSAKTAADSAPSATSKDSASRARHRADSLAALTSATAEHRDSPAHATQPFALPHGATLVTERRDTIALTLDPELQTFKSEGLALRSLDVQLPSLALPRGAVGVIGLRHLMSKDALAGFYDLLLRLIPNEAP